MQRKRLLGIGFCLVLAVGAAFGQAPAFEVASIKPSGPPDPAKIMSGQMRVGITIDKGRVDIGFWPLTELIRTAYRVKAYQVQGPSWMLTERFDIHATYPEGVSKEQVPEMLQALLADRFKLKMHRDGKEQNIYALVVAKGGSKLKESVPDADVPPPEEPKTDGGIAVGTTEGQMRVKPTANGMSTSGGPGGPMKMTMAGNGVMHMEWSKMTMTAFAEAITPMVDRTVIDMTELKGTYQVGLDLTMDDMRAMARKAGMAVPGGAGGGEPGKGPAEAASDPGGGSIFSTVQQLGLKLESRKSPIDQIIIDHLEKVPTDN